MYIKTSRGVDDETLNVILQPGLDPAAASVFLDFISYRYIQQQSQYMLYVIFLHLYIIIMTLLFLYMNVSSGGPLPEELLERVTLPVSIMWGEHDPWEPIEMGRSSFTKYPCVKEFIVLEDAGHCPMDQVPDSVNREVKRFMKSLK